MEYLTVKISAENKEQSDIILNSLLEKKLVTGGQIICSPARFLWKGEIVDMDYCTITTFTLDKYKNDIIEDVDRTSVEEVPMIRFIHFEGNKKLEKWISETLS